MKSRFWLILLSIWTPLALAAGWWLWHMEPGPPVVVRAGVEQGAGAWWKLFHRNFHPVYPWLLLAPYVFFLCARFPLGIRRTAVVVPVLLLSCGAFVATCISFSARVERNTPSLVYVDTQPESSPRRAEFTRKLLEIVRENLATPDAATPEIRLLDGGTIEITRTVGNQEIPAGKQVQPLTVITELHFDLETDPAAPDADPSSVIPTERAVIFAFEDDLLPEPAASSPGNPPLPAPDVPGVRAPLLPASGLNIAGFLLLAVLAHSGVYFRQFREREQRNSRLNQELTEARLSNLQHQLQPHFLFNALNGISSHIHDQPDRAVDMISLLADLLRRSFDQSADESLTPLREELASLDHYLELQSMRFGERLRVTREIAPDTLDLRVPPFLLQPLAENFVRHAVETTPGPRHLTITTRLENQRLLLLLSDDGPGPLESSPNPGTGTGLRNIRQRLASHFPDNHHLAIGPGPDELGTLVRIDLPAPPPSP